MKRQGTDWEKVFTNHVSNKGFVKRFIKKLQKSLIETQTI